MRRSFLFPLLLAVAACTGYPDSSPDPTVSPDLREEGMASWYGEAFHGKPTANGEIFDQTKLTAAHRTLPFDTVVRVLNTTNGKSVTVRINDRGPFVAGRIIDLSRSAAEALGMLESGIAPVVISIE